MTENTDYITSDNTIIFSCEYNKQLDPGLLSHYKKIFFSDYALSNELFEACENSNINKD